MGLVFFDSDDEDQYTDEELAEVQAEILQEMREEAWTPTDAEIAKIKVEMREEFRAELEQHDLAMSVEEDGEEI